MEFKRDSKQVFVRGIIFFSSDRRGEWRIILARKRLGMAQYADLVCRQPFLSLCKKYGLKAARRAPQFSKR
ncbi:hypothetical protein [Evansella clarkii]|uniref:hypothetical protein n=1 Tax=Evansella clarkii TaxID=79879 RepID=UPI0009966D8C|nr:hypothetical protein [Evansella clarkii]